MEFQISNFEAIANRLNASIDQVPYALSRTLNDAAFDARNKIISDTWPRSITQRNPGFMRAALRIDRSNKYDLTVAIRDQNGHGHLAEHAMGGTKIVQGRNIAIPLQSRIKLGPRGVAKQDRPRAIIARTPKRALRITDRGIFMEKAVSFAWSTSCSRPLASGPTSHSSRTSNASCALLWNGYSHFRSRLQCKVENEK